MGFKETYNLVMERIAPNAPRSKHKFTIEVRSDLGKTKYFGSNDPIDAIRIFMRVRKFDEGEATLIAKQEKDAKMFWNTIVDQLDEVNELLGFDHDMWSMVLKVFNAPKGYSWDSKDGSIHPFSYQAFM